MIEYILNYKKYFILVTIFILNIIMSLIIINKETDTNYYDNLYKKAVQINELSDIGNKIINIENNKYKQNYIEKEQSFIFDKLNKTETENIINYFLNNYIKVKSINIDNNTTEQNFSLKIGVE